MRVPFFCYLCKFSVICIEMKRLFYILAVILLAAVSCTKEGPAPELKLTSDDELTVSANGGELYVRFTTNQDDWAYDLGGATWISVEKGKNVLNLSVSANDAYESRSTTIQVYAPADGSNRASAGVKLTQAAKELVPEIVCSPEGVLSVKAEASTQSVDVTTNMDSWTFESSADWISASASGNKLSLDITANPKETDRDATIKFYAPSKDNPQAQTILKVVQSGIDVEYPLTTLSSDGTSNCYLISHMGEYCFDATVKGNGLGCKGLSAPSKMSPAGAKLVWQTSKGMIESVELKDGKIHFVAGKIPGNALLAVTDGNGEIIWSWHIWRPDVEISALDSKSGAQVMNINLGATTDDYTDVGCYGLLYQWGRKDPFPGSPIPDSGSITTKNVPVYDIDGKAVDIVASDMYSLTANTLAYSIAHPTVCLSNNSQFSKCRDWLTPSESNPSFWGNPDGFEHTENNYKNTGSKTFYDPCPAGWRVPSISVFQHLTSTGGIVWATGESDGKMVWSDLGGEAEFQAYDFDHNGMVNLLDFTNGWWLYLSKTKGVYSFFPATTRYDGQYAMLMGSMVGLWGNYWYNTADVTNGVDSYLGVALSFGIKDYGSDNYSVTASPISSGSRADAYAIRCIKE